MVKQNVEIINVTTDFGSDCDDQLMNKLMIDNLERLLASSGNKTQIKLLITVNGPQPFYGAAAIREYFNHKCGNIKNVELCLWEGTQFEQELRSEDEIYSLVDGQPMKNKNVDHKNMDTSLSDHMKQIIDDKKIKITKFTQKIFSPIHNQEEFFNPHSLSNKQKSKWNKIEKRVFQAQFQNKIKLQLGNDKSSNKDTLSLPLSSFSKGIKSFRNRALDKSNNQKDIESSNLGGNNWNKTNGHVQESIAESFSCYNDIMFFDGNIAKESEFLFSVDQENENIGFQEAAKSYLLSSQLGWLMQQFDNGKMPKDEDMTFFMFTNKASFPFGVHATGGNPAGFGIERFIKEVLGISDVQKIKTVKSEISLRIDECNQWVFKELNNLGFKSVDDVKKAMKDELVEALKSYSLKYFYKEADSFVELNNLFKENKEAKLNSYNFMKGNENFMGFKEYLMNNSPTIKAVNECAEKIYSDKNVFAGLIGDFIEAKIVKEYQARAVVYDGIAEAFWQVSDKMPEVRQYFLGGTNVINFSQQNFTQLKKDDNALYEKFTTEVRSYLEKSKFKFANIINPSPNNSVENAEGKKVVDKQSEIVVPRS